MAIAAMIGAQAMIVPAPGWARNIDEAVRRGLINSPDLRAIQASEGATDTDIAIAKGGYYPQVSVSGGPQSVDLDGFAYDITAAQMLFDWGRVASAVDSARATRSKLSAQKLVKRDEIALDVVEAYIDIMATERQITAANEYIGRLSALQQVTDARAKGNYTDRSEPERTTLELARAREQLVIEQGTLEDARNRYAILVGEEPSSLAEPTPRSMTRYVAAQDLGALVHASPGYQVAVADTRSAEANLKEAKASLYPQLNAEVSTMRRPIGGVARSDTIVGIRFRMNTLQGFTNFLRPRGMAQRVEAARLGEGAVERDTLRKLRSLIDQAALMEGREEALRAQVNSSVEVSQTYYDQFTVGRRDLLDILTTRREQFEAQRKLNEVHFDWIRIQYRAAAQLGLIGPLLEGRLG